MGTEKVLDYLGSGEGAQDRTRLIPFSEFLGVLKERPYEVMRDVFQVFHDMMRFYLGEGIRESADEADSDLVYYDGSRLFADGFENPFFADHLLANRLMRQVETFRRAAQQNKIYIFEGPPGSGKSTFLNNLLRRFQDYTNAPEGSRFEVVWRLSPKLFGSAVGSQVVPVLEELLQPEKPAHDQLAHLGTAASILVPCPCHDNPILLIPKEDRQAFYDSLFRNDEFKWKLFKEKQYTWVFQESPCTVCSSMYQALLDILGSPQKALESAAARHYAFDRRLGQGISVFNPGDKPMKETVLTNPKLQERIDTLLRDSNRVRYVFSHYAKTNGGVYALMDIKGNNTERLIELHNIVSEGVHKVEDIEESVRSLFVALMNPEDKANIDGIPSFTDRVEYIRIPYVLDLTTEVAIYRNTFGTHIDASFLPRVLANFARVIISTRLSPRSEALLEWIEDPRRYSKYCDKNLQLLKMEIYAGHIPQWLSQEDRKRFTPKRHRRVLAESESEGTSGLSGRDSLKIFNEFYSTFVRPDRLIDMAMVQKYFTEVREDLAAEIPDGFLDSLVRLYNYTVLNEVKEALFFYNEGQISRDIQNYLFAINFELGTSTTCAFTGDRLQISDDFLAGIERRILGAEASDERREEFRAATQKTYTAKTLTQEIGLQGKSMTETRLFATLRDRYIASLREKVLDPFLANENFRSAIKDFGTEAFRTYDSRIREEVTFLIRNLVTRHGYTELGAREVCIYVIDNDLARGFWAWASRLGQ